MFKKKKCGNCRSKISDKYDFCPYCGRQMNQDSGEDFGMLGKNDSFNEFDNFSKSIFGGFGGNMLNKMLGNAMRILEKEMKNEMKKEDSQPKTDFQLFINGKKMNLGGNPFLIQKLKKEKKVQVKKFSPIVFSKEKSKKFADLPKKTPATNIRRFSDKVVYEIDVPDVKSVDDISVVQFENSIEIKAIAKNKAYLKIIPIGLPLVDYKLEDKKIILELEERG